MGVFGRVLATAVTVTFAAGLVITDLTVAGSRSPTTSTSTFRLHPKKDRIEVTVRVTVTNRIRDEVTVAPCAQDRSRTCRTTTRFYVDEFGYFPIQMGAREVEFAGPGVKARIDHANLSFTNYIVRFAPIYNGQTRTFDVSYHLPAAKPRSLNRTRITRAYAHFCWHGPPTDRGSVRAILPSTFVPSTRYGDVSSERSGAGLVLTAKRTSDIGRFYACTDTFKPAKLLRTRTTSPSGQVITVEGWPEDPEWSAAITEGVETTLARLETLAGAPIPGEDIVIRQVAAQALGGYAGDHSDRSEEIRVGERYDDPILVAHELAHAWFNRGTAKDDWIIEGHAEWMAHEANASFCDHPGDYPGKGDPKLRDWQYLGVSPTEREEDVVDYQYQAACRIVQQIDRTVGRERMAEITRTLLERTPKYGGTADPKAPKPDWREWLDAVDEIGLVPSGRGDYETAERLLVAYGAVKPTRLQGRAEARALYHDVLERAGEEHMPVFVRDHMDAWEFRKATAALSVIEEIVDLSDQISDGFGGEDTDDVLRSDAVLLRLAGAATMRGLKEIRRDLRAEPRQS